MSRLSSCHPKGTFPNIDPAKLWKLSRQGVDTRSLAERFRVSPRTVLAALQKHQEALDAAEWGRKHAGYVKEGLPN